MNRQRQTLYRQQTRSLVTDATNHARVDNHSGGKRTKMGGGNET